MCPSFKPNSFNASSEILLNMSTLSKPSSMSLSANDAKSTSSRRRRNASMLADVLPAFKCFAAFAPLPVAMSSSPSPRRSRIGSKVSTCFACTMTNPLPKLFFDSNAKDTLGGSNNSFSLGKKEKSFISRAIFSVNCIWIIVRSPFSPRNVFMTSTVVVTDEKAAHTKTSSASRSKPILSNFRQAPRMTTVVSDGGSFFKAFMKSQMKSLHGLI
mmetsp:Transcript_54756/g.86682  ORF Transcript_54756/g.86682 Transcript_54756/m.86682 type:complete len:214 (+) Transcript_54756:839-1480(+)